MMGFVGSGRSLVWSIKHWDAGDKIVLTIGYLVHHEFVVYY